MTATYVIQVVYGTSKTQNVRAIFGFELYVFAPSPRVIDKLSSRIKCHVKHERFMSFTCLFAVTLTTL